MNTLYVLLDLLRGFGVTLRLFVLTLAVSLPLGLVFALASMSRFKPLSLLMRCLIWVVRGTPLLLQCIVVTFLPYAMGVPNKEAAAALGVSVSSLQFLFVLSAFALNYACYFAVIYEGGIRSIPRGQYEAGLALGMTKGRIFLRVLLMQMVRAVMAPVSNEVITLVKDTALARALGVIEVIAVANEKVNKYAVLTPLLYAGLFYLAFSGLLTLLFRWAERRLNYYSV